MGPELRCYRANRDLNRCGVIEKDVFFSRWYRGLAPGMEWMRLTLEASRPLKVRIYATDSPGEFSCPMTEAPVLQATARDFSLYGVKGQYLSFSVEPAGGLEGYALFFPGRSIAEGLPAILQEDPLLRRLLAVCQSEYLDLNLELAHFPQRLDPKKASALPGLARWLGAGRWGADETALRRLLPCAVLLGRLRGTRRGLVLAIRLLTGQNPIIQENPGGTPTVTILLPAGISPGEERRVRHLLPDFIPLGMTYDMARLKEEILLDGYTYLEENTLLTQEPAFTLLDGPENGSVILE